MGLKFWGLILLALSGAVGVVCIFYRLYAHIPACKEEYQYRLSRSGRLPGSRRKKDDSEVMTAVMTADISEKLPDETQYAQTAVMTADISAEMRDELQYAETALMEE